MKLVETIDFIKIVDLIYQAKAAIYISLSCIDETIAEALLSRKNEISINVVIDNSEDSIRNGFGELDAVEKLQSEGINLRECPGNLVSFIISDDEGYFLFPQSRIFSENPLGSNAVRIDPFSLKAITISFFPKGDMTMSDVLDGFQDMDSVELFQENLMDGIIENGTSVETKTFSEDHFNEIKERLVLNPPLAPDLQRNINVYNSKIQFVEFRFEGGNLQNKIIHLPQDAIPIDSEELRNLLQTRIRLFQDISQHEEFQKFQDFKHSIEELRKKFLIPITCRKGKSIITTKNKNEFIKELDKLKKNINNFNKSIIESMETEVLNTIDLLRKELNAFFISNEPHSLKLINNPSVKERKRNNMINNILSSIKFPDIERLVEKISLKEIFYDLTWNDFKDEELLGEFEEKKIIEHHDIVSIIELKKAFETTT